MTNEEKGAQENNEQTILGEGSEIAADNNGDVADQGASQAIDKTTLNSIPVSISVELLSLIHI